MGNALSKRELHTLSTHIYFSSFALSSRAPANYKFGTCTDMFTVRRLYFIINGIARESAGWLAHERTRTPPVTPVTLVSGARARTRERIRD